MDAKLMRWVGSGSDWESTGVSRPLGARRGLCPVCGQRPALLMGTSCPEAPWSSVWWGKPSARGPPAPALGTKPPSFVLWQLLL